MQFVNHLKVLRLEFIPIILTLHFVVIFFRTVRQKVLFESIDVKLSFKEQVLIHISGLALIMTPGEPSVSYDELIKLMLIVI